MTEPRRQLGDRGEALAREYLQQRGYRILASNYRRPRGEVDLVAEDGTELVFVEVRTRRTTAFGTPEESITPAKARRLRLAAQEYLREHRREEDDWRIDLVSVRLERGQPHPRIDHLKHAVEQ